MRLAINIGLAVADLDTITIGMLNDLACVMSNENGIDGQVSYDEL